MRPLFCLLLVCAAAPALAANVYWVGKAPTVAQVDTVTPANVEIDDTFTVTCNTKTVTFKATAGTVANVTAGLTAAINNSSEPEFSELVATDASTTVQVRHDTAGVPFTITASAADGGGANTQTLTKATATAASSKNHWDAAANWSSGAVPVSTNDVFIESGPDIKYGLAQSAVTLNSLHVARTFEREIGLPQRNAAGYQEYRDTFLAISADDATIGGGGTAGDGSRLIRLNTGSNACDVVVWYTHPSPSEDDPTLESFCWIGTHNSNTVTVHEGQVGIARRRADAATVNALSVNRARVTEDSPVVRVGSGTTLTSVTCTGGIAEVFCDFDSLYMLGGQCYLYGSTFTGDVWLLNGPIRIARP